MSFIAILVFLVILFFTITVYFKIANHYNIIDAPNHRSSHKNITLRGGGIIFPIAAILWFFNYGYSYPYFFVGLLSIATISFLDDVFTLKNKARLIVHLFSVFLMFMEWGLYNVDWFWLIIALIFVIGTINAYNFMDGINGITGIYSALTVSTLWFINNYNINFTSNTLLILILLSLIVFNYYNFRINAKCFAGDVGSVSIAYILIFLIGQLILKTGDFKYILLFFIYGLDTVSTVIFRLYRKENIFKAHRTHFYQYLVNQKKLSHLTVSFVYFVSQLVVSVITIFFLNNSVFKSLLFIIICTLVFLIIRFRFEGKNSIFGIK